MLVGASTFAAQEYRQKRRICGVNVSTVRRERLDISDLVSIHPATPAALLNTRIQPSRWGRGSKHHSQLQLCVPGVITTMGV